MVIVIRSLLVLYVLVLNVQSFHAMKPCDGIYQSGLHKKIGNQDWNLSIVSYPTLLHIHGWVVLALSFSQHGQRPRLITWSSTVFFFFLVEGIFHSQHKQTDSDLHQNNIRWLTRKSSYQNHGQSHWKILKCDRRIRTQNLNLQLELSLQTSHRT